MMNRNWELRILNDIPKDIKALNGLAVGDIENDGHVEVKFPRDDSNSCN
jgi:hypothetical protein